MEMQAREEPIRQSVEAETFLLVRWVCPICQRKCRCELQWVRGDQGGIFVGMPHNRPGTKEKCPENITIRIEIPSFEVDVYNTHNPERLTDEVSIQEVKS